MITVAQMKTNFNDVPGAGVNKRAWRLRLRSTFLYQCNYVEIFSIYACDRSTLCRRVSLEGNELGGGVEGFAAPDGRSAD